MKKTIITLLVMLLLVAVCITAGAAGRHNFADADNNGICDNRDSADCNNMADRETKNGHCKMQGSRNGHHGNEYHH